MNKRRFGRTGLFVSEICLGTGRLSWLACQSESFAILDAFVDVGGNYIQTSARKSVIDSIRSENIVGSWLKLNPGLRENLVLSSTVRAPENAKGAALEDIVRRQLEGSLRRLGTQHIDTLLVDWTDGGAPLELLLSAVERLVNAGMLRYAGSIGLPCWRIAEGLGRSGSRGGCRLESAHFNGSLVDDGLMDLAREHKVALVARWPLRNAGESAPYAAQILPDCALRDEVACLLSHDAVTSVEIEAVAQWQVLDANRIAERALAREAVSRRAVANGSSTLQSGAAQNGAAFRPAALMS